MDVDGKLIAIIGPNEAGKSSLLEALEWLSDETPAQERQRTRHLPSPKTFVWARFVLEEADREALSGVPEAAGVRQLVITKEANGGAKTEFVGPVHRDKRLRERVRKLLGRAADLRWLHDREDEGWLASVMASVAASLDTNTGTLGEETLAAVRDLETRLRQEALPRALVKLPDELAQLAEHEEAPHPQIRTTEILLARVPELIKFDADARDLRRSYGFDDEINGALRNFLALAGTDWEAVQAATSDPGRLKGLTDATDERLRQAFEAWQQQPGLTVGFQVSDRTLHLLVRMSTTSDYVAIDERSDGLRQFVALRAYLHARGNGRPPVLLIDEAESHLHYDAQADLLDVFGKQREAAKVIYTTHSAGCLPPDLGTGVRIVLPVLEPDDDGALRDTDRSRIVNWFWASEIEGHAFSPLLIGMGAGTFAFASTRKAVIGEGASDAILLPTLLREATELTQLDFQVAPGLSNVSAEAVAELDLAAARVAYLVDGDPGGVERKALLISNGVPKSRILMLGTPRQALELEDLVRPDVYLQAVNEELKRWYGAEMPASALTDKDRSDAVKKWCASQPGDMAAPSKAVVAHRIVDQRSEGSLLQPTRVKLLQKLHEDIERLLAKPTHQAAEMI